MPILKGFKESERGNVTYHSATILILFTIDRSCSLRRGRTRSHSHDMVSFCQFAFIMAWYSGRAARSLPGNIFDESQSLWRSRGMVSTASVDGAAAAEFCMFANRYFPRSVTSVLSAASILNHRVSHQGGSTINSRLVGRSFQMPSLFAACTRKVWLSGSRLVQVTSRLCDGGDHSRRSPLQLVAITVFSGSIESLSRHKLKTE